MTKLEFALKIAKEMNMPCADVKRIIQMTLDGIIETLVTEGRLEFRGFGVYEVKTRKPRVGRNPRTGEIVSIPSHKSVTFKAGRFMLNGVNGLVEAQNQEAGSEFS